MELSSKQNTLNSLFKSLLECKETDFVKFTGMGGELYYEVLCLGYALACARITRPNFLFDFRRKGMRESGPLSFLFFLFIYFSFFFF